MTTTTTRQNKSKSQANTAPKAKVGPLSKVGGWLRTRFERWPKAPVKIGRRAKVVAQVGDAEKRRVNIGGVVARIALTALVAEVFIVVTRPALEAPCGLRQWTGNAVVDPHWPDIRRWCPAIMRASETYHLDPYLIAALMLVESGGQPEVISRSGAVGLMQVMPRDGLAASFQCIAGPCFANRPSIAELKNPDFNVDYGARLLSVNKTRTGSMREALKSYGPHNVGYTYADGVLRIYETIR